MNEGEQRGRTEKWGLHILYLTLLNHEQLWKRAELTRKNQELSIKTNLQIHVQFQGCNFVLKHFRQTYVEENMDWLSGSTWVFL